jgi:hypothetical protein
VHISRSDPRQHITIEYHHGQQQVGGTHHIVVNLRELRQIIDLMNQSGFRQAAEQRRDEALANYRAAQQQLQAAEQAAQQAQAQVQRASSEASSAMNSIDEETRRSDPDEVSDAEQERRRHRANRFGPSQ